MRFVSYSDRKKVAAALRPIYTAPTAEAAAARAGRVRRLRPRASATRPRSRPGRNAWERFIPFLAFPPELPQDHLHHQRDRVAELPAPQDHQEPRPLPHRRRRDQAALAGDPRHRGQTSPRPRQGERAPPANDRKAPGRLVEGASRPGLETALGALAIAYPDRLEPLPQPTDQPPYTENLTGSAREPGRLIVCCDGLTGFPEAIEATWPPATVQTCVVHLIRAAMRFVSYTDRKKVAAALKPIYTPPTAEAADRTRWRSPSRSWAASIRPR